MSNRKTVTSAVLNGRSVLFLTKYSAKGASSRLRFLQYVPALERAGAKITISSLFDDGYLTDLYGEGKRRIKHVLSAYLRRIAVLLTVGNYDVVWIEKEQFPFFPGVIEGLIRLFKRPYIIDYDDAIFHTYDSNANLLVRKVLSNKLTSLISHSSAVTVGNNYLSDYVARNGACNIVHLPTVVDLDRYPVVPRTLKNELRIGWIGSPSTSGYLIPLLSILQRVAQTFPIRLVTIGATPLHAPGLPVEQHPWSEDSEAMLLSSIDVGLMPLPDEPFERGKCGYKLIQYMACSLPVIASPIGVNCQIVSSGINGLLASNGEEWFEALMVLLGNAPERQRMGNEGRRRVEALYSLSSQQDRVVQLLHSIVEGSGRRTLTQPILSFANFDDA